MQRWLVSEAEQVIPAGIKILILIGTATVEEAPEPVVVAQENSVAEMTEALVLLSSLDTTPMVRDGMILIRLSRRHLRRSLRFMSLEVLALAEIPVGIPVELAAATEIILSPQFKAR